MAIKKDGTVIIDTRVDTKGFNKGVGNMQKSVTGLIGSISKIGAAVGLAFGVKALVDFGKEAINLASDLEEVQNVVDTVFGNMAGSIEEFSKDAITQFGLSELSAKKYSSTMGAMLKSMGFDTAKTLEMSTRLTGLAGDIASFYNLTSEEAFGKIRSGISGETEPLKQLGINLSVANLEAYALAEGITKSYNAMSQQEQAMLRYNYLLKTTADAQGDFARTSGSWSNQVKILTEQFNSLKATVGEGLIAVFTPVIRVLNMLLAKIQTVANSFKALMKLIFGKKEDEEDTSSGSGNLADDYESAADSAGEMADASAKAAKENEKNLSSLDKLNVLQSKAASNSGGGEGGSSDSSEIDFGEMTDEVKDADSAISKIAMKIKELMDSFRSGFLEGLGDTNERLKTIDESIDSIKKSLSEIFDGDFNSKAFEITKKLFKSFGRISGSISSIGLTIGANLTGGIAKYLEDEKERIQDYLLSIFDISASITDKASEFMSSFAYIFEEWSSEDGQQITSDLIAIFTNPFMEISELMGKYSLDIITLLVDPFVNSEETLRDAFGNLISGFSDFTGSVRKIFDDFFGFINDAYDKHISPVFEKLIPDLEGMWQEHIAPLLTSIGELFSEIGEALSTLWEEVVKPFLAWFDEKIMPIVSKVMEGVGKSIINTIGFIADSINFVVKICKDLTKFITGVFTGDWKKAWEGIKGILKTVWDGIVDVVRKPVNAIIDIMNSLIESFASGVNTIINAANKFSLDIPEWIPEIGGKSFGINIPKVTPVKIPYLASGAVIPPNAPFLAMLGDQRNGTNIEAPLSTIEEALTNVLNRRGDGDIVVQIDGREVFRAVRRQNKDFKTRTGSSAFA